MSHQIVFSIPDDLAVKLVEVTDKTPIDLARDFLMGYFEDGRNYQFARQKISIAWQEEVYAGIIRHVGRGAAADWIRKTAYSNMPTGVVTPPPTWLPARIKESKSKNKRPKFPVLTPGAGRQSVVIPLIVPRDWVLWLKKEYPDNFSMPIKVWCQLRLEKETGKKFPVQRGLSEMLGHN